MPGDRVEIAHDPDVQVASRSEACRGEEQFIRRLDVAGHPSRKLPHIWQRKEGSVGERLVGRLACADHESRQAIVTRLGKRTEECQSVVSHMRSSHKTLYVTPQGDLHGMWLLPTAVRRGSDDFHQPESFHGE